MVTEVPEPGAEQTMTTPRSMEQGIRGIKEMNTDTGIAAEQAPV